MASRRTIGSKSKRSAVAGAGRGDRARDRGLRRRRRRSRRRRRRSAPRPPAATTEITLWHGYGELAAAGEEPNTELDSLKAQVDAFQAGEPEHQGRHDLRQLRQRAAEADGRAAGRQGAGRHLPVRHQPAAARDVAEGGRPHRAAWHDADYNWNDFPAGERDVFTIDGKVFGVPALVDNLAVVYNKDLFAAAGLAEPTARLDVGRAGRRREGADRPAARSSSASSGRSTAARRRSGSTSRCCGRPAATCCRPTARRRRSPRRRASTALTALGDLAQGQGAVPRRRARQPEGEPALQRQQDRHVHHRPVEPADFPDAQVRRAGDAVFPGGSHDTIAGPTPGW